MNKKRVSEKYHTAIIQLSHYKFTTLLKKGKSTGELVVSKGYHKPTKSTVQASSKLTDDRPITKQRARPIRSSYSGRNESRKAENGLQFETL